MFDKKAAEEPSDDFSLSHFAGQDDIIANIRARREAPQQSINEQEEASLAQLSPEERARREAYNNAVRSMISEKENASPKTRRTVRNFSLSQYVGGRERDPRVVSGVVLGAIGLAAFLGPGIISDAGYGEEQATHYLEETGYTNVELTNKSRVLVGWQGCDGDDAVKYSFEATALNGADADVIVCKGMFKGATIRD